MAASSGQPCAKECFQRISELLQSLLMASRCGKLLLAQDLDSLAAADPAERHSAFCSADIYSSDNHCSERPPLSTSSGSSKRFVSTMGCVQSWRTRNVLIS